MFAPRLIPATIRSAGESRRLERPSFTQSDGVPLTEMAFFTATGNSTSVVRSGRSSVSEWLAALLSRFGATTVTAPNSIRASESATIPFEKIPSSLLTRICTVPPPIVESRQPAESGKTCPRPPLMIGWWKIICKGFSCLKGFRSRQVMPLGRLTS